MKIDEVFKYTLSQIMLEEKWEDQSRAKYADGTPVKVKRALQVFNTYDLQEEFPIGSIRPVPLHNAIKEILWIWQKRSTNTKDLGLKIWDAWADENGRIKGCYADMVKRPVVMSDKWEEGLSPLFVKCLDKDMPVYGFKNQTDFLLYEITHNPSSRRMVASMFNPETNNIKPLQECAFQIQLSVKNGFLHMVLYQRSCDFITAFLWNTAQYAALLMMFAHHAGLKPGKFSHFIGDCHVYDRHEKQAMELLSRDLNFPKPEVSIHPRMELLGFYDFTYKDFMIENYEPGESIKFEVAI